MIAKEWQKLTKQQKQKYKDAAKRDKERYANELTKLSRVGDSTLLYQMPKKPLTAYMFFVRQTRTRVAQDHPEIAPLDIMKEVGRIWQRQTAKDLSGFKILARDDQLRYQRELEGFISHINSLRTQPSIDQSPQTPAEKSVSTQNVTPLKLRSEQPQQPQKS
jgi:hypothetical protein